jgi:hypothetical protein
MYVAGLNVLGRLNFLSASQGASISGCFVL